MWDERFDREDYVYGEQPNTFLTEQCQKLELAANPGPVLCLAEGEGRNAVHLATLGHDVTCVDLSEVGLRKAKLLADKHGVSINTEKADLATYETKANFYQAVVMIFAHTPSATRQRSLKQARKALRPNGYLVLEGYSTAQIGRGTGGPGTADMMFDERELRSIFAHDEILLCRAIERDIREGQFHSGIGSVVQFVARKMAPSS
ncbi:class I SAM-dependent methyltransferase [Marinobacter sp.]|uniref:class I SAM-dependent methyltransferase n=1 Tax=Marinobacter sp. TaxID=50741 RepID=UPI003569DB61